MSVHDFEILNKLGEGAFSNVFKVRRKSDGHFYALKKVKMNSLKPKEKENALNEVRILASVSHENIIAYKEAFIDIGTDTLCIIMEFAEGGDLLQKINEHKRNRTWFSEPEIFSILIQIINGLKSLHNARILHRDLKCANIFLSATGEVKLGDLNVSKVNKAGLAYTETGTPYYASPEVWNDKPYNYSSDIWSLGCVIYEMTALNPPFTGRDMKGLYRNVIRGIYEEIPNEYSRDLSEVIRSMLEVNPISRPSCERLLEMSAIRRYFRIPANESNPELLETIKFNYDPRVLKTRLPGPNYEEPRTSRRMSSNSPRNEVVRSSSHRRSGHSESVERNPEERIRRNDEPRPVRLPPSYRRYY